MLYRIVAEHLETFLAEARDNHERPLPRYVEHELRAYLECGILEYGFLRALCRDCDVRVTSWLRRRGLLSEGDGSDPGADAPERSALDACLEGSLGLGELSELPGQPLRPVADEEPLTRPSKSARRGGSSRGFDIHAGVAVSARDREGASVSCGTAPGLH